MKPEHLFLRFDSYQDATTLSHLSFSFSFAGVFQSISQTSCHCTLLWFTVHFKTPDTSCSFQNMGLMRAPQVGISLRVELCGCSSPGLGLGGHQLFLALGDSHDLWDRAEDFTYDPFSSVGILPASLETLGWGA